MAQGLGSLATVASGIFIARIMPPEEYGNYAVFAALVAATSVIPMAGIPHVIVANVPTLVRTDHSGAFKLIAWTNWHILRLSLVLGAIVLTAQATGLLFDFNALTALAIVILIAIRSFQAQLSSILNSCFLPVHALLVLGFLGPAFILLASALIATLKTIKFEDMVWLNVLAYSLVVGIGILFTSQRAPRLFVPRIERQGGYKLGYFAGLVILQTLNTQLAVIWLGYTVPDSIVANFRVALLVATMPSLITTAVNTIALPQFSASYHAGNTREMRATFQRLTLLLVVVTTPVLVVALIYAETLTTLLFSEKYEMAADMLRIMFVGSTISMLFGLVPALLNMTGRQRVSFLGSAAAILTNILTLAVLSNVMPALAGPISFVVSSGVYYLTLTLVAFQSFRRSQ